MMNMEKLEKYTEKISRELFNDKAELAQRPENSTLTDYITEFSELSEVLTPLEINIRLIEEELKKFIITLKYSEEYQKYKSLEAKKEQAYLETSDLRREILKLKLERNKLRDRVELCKYTISLLQRRKPKWHV